MEITHNEYINVYVRIILIIKANIMWLFIALNYLQLSQ